MPPPLTLAREHHDIADADEHRCDARIIAGLGVERGPPDREAAHAESKAEARKVAAEI
jgi:hypothetical protein